MGLSVGILILNNMKILIACEESQTVCKAFRELLRSLQTPDSCGEEYGEKGYMYMKKSDFSKLFCPRRLVFR